MKKILLTALTITALISCKKNEQEIQPITSEKLPEFNLQIKIPAINFERNINSTRTEKSYDSNAEQIGYAVEFNTDSVRISIHEKFSGDVIYFGGQIRNEIFIMVADDTLNFCSSAQNVTFDYTIKQR